jgi:WD40 repeat protein
MVESFWERLEMTTDSGQIFLMGVVIAFCTGCGSVPPSHERQASTKRIAGSISLEPTDPKVKIAGPVTPEREVGVIPEMAVIRPPNPLLLKLPAMDEFLRMPLPKADPQRYRRWRKRGRIWVGQSHLSEAELIDDERLLLAMSSAEGTVRVYDRITRKLLGNHSIPGLERFGRGDLAAWPDTGHEPTFLFGKSDGLWLFSATNGEPLAHLDEMPVWQLRWSPDQHVLVSGLSEIKTQTSSLVFYKRLGLAGIERLATIPFAERVDAWDLSRDNRFLAVIYYPSNTLELIDLHAGTSLWRIPTPDFGGDVAISPDGRSIVMGGAGILLVNASDPTKRTLYTQFGNNVGRVRFSPSSDAIVTSSYDGRVRIFAYDSSARRLELIKTLAHAGSANVYELQFFNNGDGLISTSGDKTIRYWGDPSAPKHNAVKMLEPIQNANSAPHERASLSNSEAMTKTVVPQPTALTEEERRAQLAQVHATPRHRPEMLDAPPQPSRIKPGRYACRVSTGYKLRDCLVEKTPSGHTILEVGKGNLIGMRGVLYDDGKVVRFEGWPTDARPFGCFSCQERCFISPDTCGCTPKPMERIIGCLRQPLHAVFKKSGRNWKGVVIYRDYYDEHIPIEIPPSSVTQKNGIDRFEVFLKPL